MNRSCFSSISVVYSYIADWDSVFIDSCIYVKSHIVQMKTQLAPKKALELESGDFLCAAAAPCDECSIRILATTLAGAGVLDTGGAIPTGGSLTTE